MRSNIIFIALVALAAYGVVCTFTCNGLKISRDRVEDNVKGTRDSLHSFITKDSTKGAVIAAQEGTIAELKATNAAIINDRKEKLGLDDGQIEGAQNVTAEVRSTHTASVNATVRPNPHGDDTVETASACDSNSSISIAVTQDSVTGKRTMHTNDTSVVDLHLTEFINQWSIHKPFKKPGPFATPEHEVSAYSRNKKVKITGLESVLVIKEKPKILKTATAVGLGILTGLVIHNLLK